MDIFRKIEQSFEANRATHTFNRTLIKWREAWPILEELGDADDIARASRDPGPRALKDAIHVALCVEAAGRGKKRPKDELASIFLCWIFLPGLVLTAKELATTETFDEVSADLLAGFLEAASKVRPTSTHVARHLMRGARLRALTSLRRTETRSSRELELDLEKVGSDDPTASARVLVADALREGIVRPMEIDLLLTEREDLAEAAAAYGLTHANARQVKSRARRRLESWFSESSRGPLRD